MARSQKRIFILEHFSKWISGKCNNETFWSRNFETQSTTHSSDFCLLYILRDVASKRWSASIINSRYLTSYRIKAYRAGYPATARILKWSALSNFSRHLKARVWITFWELQVNGEFYSSVSGIKALKTRLCVFPYSIGVKSYNILKISF